MLIPVFALRSPHDLGIGDTEAMRDAIDFCHRNKIGVLQVLPINESGGDNSPYNAISSIALDPALLSISPDTVPGLTKETFAQLAPEAHIAELRSGPVDYPRVKHLKLELLRAGFKEFDKGPKDSPEHKLFQGFQHENRGWLEPYTLFRTIVAEHHNHAVWTHWEPELKTYEGAVSWLNNHNRKSELEQSRNFWAYVQWLAFKQWLDLKDYADDKNVALMGDLPFGVSRYSADVWAHRDIFDLDWSGGAPPERFFQHDVFVQKWGQNWGIPLYNWQENKKENFAWWRQRVHYLTRLFHLFRIDHVLGFFRVYAFPWVPERNEEFVALTEEEAEKLTGGLLPGFMPRSDETKEDAQLNADEGEAILRIIMDAAGDSGIVAEDLGVVPDYVRPLLKKLGIAGFYIPIFERDEEEGGREFKRSEDIPALSLATYGTHDHLPLRSFYEGLVEWWLGPDGHEGWLEVQRLMRFLELDEDNPPRQLTRNLHQRLLQVLLESPSWLTVLMVTDLLATRQRFNEPGLSGESNWSQRLDSQLNELEKDSEYGQSIRYFGELIERTGRAPHKLATARSKR